MALFLDAHEPQVRLFRLSSDQGNANAQYNLGTMYLTGRGGLAKDDVEAARLFHLSAQAGLPNAQRNLGLIYVIGKDARSAFAWYGTTLIYLRLPFIRMLYFKDEQV